MVKIIFVLFICLIFVKDIVNSTTTTLMVDSSTYNNYPPNSYCGNSTLTCNSIKDAINYFNKIYNPPTLKNKLILLLSDGVYDVLENTINGSNLNISINSLTTLGSNNVIINGTLNSTTDPIFKFTDSSVGIKGIEFTNFNTLSLIVCESSFVSITGSTFNQISTINGTIILVNSTVVIDNTNFLYNTISNINGSVITFISPNSSSSNSLTISRSTFNKNQAINGGAIYAVNAGTSGNSTISNCIFSNNRGENGGDLFFDNVNVNVLSSKFTNSSSSTAGSIIYTQNNILNINDATFVSGDSSGFFLSTIIYVINSELNITDTTSDKSISVAINCVSSKVIADGNSYPFKLVCQNCQSIIEGNQTCSSSPITSTTESSTTSSTIESSTTSSTTESSTTSSSISSTSGGHSFTTSSSTSNGNTFTVTSSVHTTTGSTSNTNQMNVITLSTIIISLLSITILLF